MRALLHPAERKAQIEEELRSFLEASVDDKLRSGMSRDEARRAAHKEIGSREMVRHKVWSAGWESWVDSLVRDLRLAARQLRNSPGFAVTAVLALAIGIGANLAVFQLLYSAMLAPLPVARPQELMSVRGAKSPYDGQWFVSDPAYERLRQATAGYAPVMARSGFGAGALEMQGAAPQPARYQMVSDNFFSVLGVKPAAGRLLEASDLRPGGGGWAVVLRYGYALRQFGTVDVVGRYAVLNGVPVSIVGVAPEGFLGVVTGYAPDVWLPLEAQSTGKFGAWFDSLGPGHGVHLGQPWAEQAGIFWLWVTARVPADERAAAVARWTAALQPDLRLMAEAVPNGQAKEAVLHTGVHLIAAAAGEGQWREDSSLPLMLLMALAGAVFVAGCLNLGNLQAARLSAREGEFSVRMSLGASRWQLLRQVLTEDLLLTVIGGALAVVTGHAASEVLLRWASTRDWVLNLDMRMSAPVLALGVGMMAAAVCVFSAAPGMAGREPPKDCGCEGEARVCGRSAEREGTAMVERDAGGAGEPVSAAGGDGGVLCEDSGALERGEYGNGPGACAVHARGHGAWVPERTAESCGGISHDGGASGCSAGGAERGGGDVRGAGVRMEHEDPCIRKGE
ncbi:MAG TPA: ABC transporter permease [Acidobacteriaceae bacterium]|nr:ABC transporter permease [Acidobacteriaceae bacterium]